MSQVAENFTLQDETALECVAALPVPEVVEHFGDAEAVIVRLMRSAERSAKCTAALEELRALHGLCCSESWQFVDSMPRKSSAFCAAMRLVDDAIDAQIRARDSWTSHAWGRARTLRLAALAAVKFAQAL